MGGRRVSNDTRDLEQLRGGRRTFDIAFHSRIEDGDVDARRQFSVFLVEQVNGQERKKEVNASEDKPSVGFSRVRKVLALSCDPALV